MDQSHFLVRLRVANGKAVTTQSSILPEILKSIRGQFSILHFVLNVLMHQLVLNRFDIAAIVSQFEPAGVAQHVGVNREL